MKLIIILLGSLIVSNLSCGQRKNGNNIATEAALVKGESNRGGQAFKLNGEWEAVRNISLPISGLGDDDIEKLMHSNIFLSDTCCIVFNDTCHSPVFKTSKIGVERYFKENFPKTPKEYLEIKKDSLLVLNLLCSNESLSSTEDSPEFNFDFLYDKEKDVFWVVNNGVFFEYKRRHSGYFLLTEKEFEFVSGQLKLSNVSSTIDSLKDVALLLKNNLDLSVTIKGNSDYKSAEGMNGLISVNGRQIPIHDFLVGRARVIADLLIKEFEINPQRVKVEPGKLEHRRSTTITIQ